MVGHKGFLAGIVAAALVAAVGIQSAFAAPTITNITDTGTLNTSFVGPPGSNSSNSVPTPFGSGSVTVTPVLSGPTTIGYKLTFSPNSGFFASSNNLAGGKSQTFIGLLSFDIAFDSAVTLTTNVFEDGIYSASGQNSRVGVATADATSGVIVKQIDNILLPEQVQNVFKNSAAITPPPSGLGGSFQNGSGVWSLYAQATGFSKAYTKYHVVIDNDLLAEALVNPNQAPGFAAIAKKDFSIVFTFDGSSGGGNIPEPASLGVLALGGLSLLARRRK